MILSVSISLEEYNMLKRVNELFNKLYETNDILFRHYSFNNKTLTEDHDNHYTFITKDKGLKLWENEITKKYSLEINKLNEEIQNKEEIINNLLDQITELKKQMLIPVVEKENDINNINLIQFIKLKYL